MRFGFFRPFGCRSGRCGRPLEALRSRDLRRQKTFTIAEACLSGVAPGTLVTLSASRSCQALRLAFLSGLDPVLVFLSGFKPAVHVAQASTDVDVAYQPLESKTSRVACPIVQYPTCFTMILQGKLFLGVTIAAIIAVSAVTIVVVPAHTIFSASGSPL